MKTEMDFYRLTCHWLTIHRYVGDVFLNKKAHSRHSQRNQGMELMKQWKNHAFIDNPQPLNMLEIRLETKVMKLMNFVSS